MITTYKLCYGATALGIEISQALKIGPAVKCMFVATATIIIIIGKPIPLIYPMRAPRYGCLLGLVT